MHSLKGEVKEVVLPTTRYIHQAAPVVPLISEPPARLFVDPPLPEPLTLGRAVIQYQVENMRMVAVYGAAALEVSPRIGHLHVTVDGGPWHWLDASGEPLTLNGFLPGEHSVLIELADPTHKVLDHRKVAFIIPAPAMDRSTV